MHETTGYYPRLRILDSNNDAILDHSDDDWIQFVWEEEETTGAFAGEITVRLYNSDTNDDTWVDDISLELSASFPSPTYTNLLFNPNIHGNLDYWTKSDGSSRVTQYNAQKGHTTLGCVTLGYGGGANITQTVTVPVADTYEISAWVAAENNNNMTYPRYIVYDDEMSQVASGSCGFINKAWEYCTTDVYLDTGDYTVKWYSSDADDESYVDDVSVYSSDVPEPDWWDPPEYWESEAWIYYPIESYFDLGYYKRMTTTETVDSAYGLPYHGYTVWQTFPDTMAYAIAPMEIIDVGTNFLGHYVTGQINAWPDVPSTTIKYEGLSSVEVAVGELVGAQCPIGRVAERWEFGSQTYHLLLGVFFPDEDTPYDPVPWMARRPSTGACQVVGDDDDPGGGTGPTPGSGTGQIWEPVCEICYRPSAEDILSIGKWIDWLECSIRNLILCWLVRILNSVIAFVIAVQQIIQAGIGWFVVQFNAFLDFLGSLWNNLRIGLSNLFTSALNAIYTSDLVQWLWSLKEIAANFFEQIIRLVSTVFIYILEFFKKFGLVFDIVKSLINIVKSILDVSPVNPFDFWGLSEGSGTGTGFTRDPAGMSLLEMLAVDGPNIGKVYWIFLLGVGTVDALIVDSGSATAITLAIFGYASLAVVAWNTILWTREKVESWTKIKVMS